MSSRWECVLLALAQHSHFREERRDQMLVSGGEFFDGVIVAKRHHNVGPVGFDDVLGFGVVHQHYRVEATAP